MEYEAAWIPEYWLLDPERQQAEFYQRGPAGRYSLVLAGAAGCHRSASLPGCWLEVGWLWQEPLPVLAVLAELGVLPQMKR